MFINRDCNRPYADTSASGMHLKKRSSGASVSGGAKIRGAAEAVLGTDLKGQNSVYDTRSGTLLTIVLLFVLGWIPMIGQMVAGFVGGRRAGSPMRGLISSSVGTFIVVAFLFLIAEGLRAINSALVNEPDGDIAMLITSYPLIEQLFDLALSYLRDLFGGADFTINYSSYAITIPFGIIGGIFANQAQKEARLIVARTGKATARRIRSMDAYKEGKSLGFETYEQYTAMSVNSMTSPAPAAAKKAQAKERTTTRSRTTPVTTTVNGAKVQSSATSSVVGMRKKQDNQDGESTVYI